MNKIKIKIQGKEFKSMKLACKFFNIGYGTFRSRLREGFSIEKALTQKLKNINPITINNKRYINRATAAKALGINSNTVKSRISAGKSLDEALNNPIIPAGEQFRLPIKEDYFKNINTKDKAYFLGLMLTDGWIQQGGQLKVEKKNRIYNEFCIGLIHHDKEIIFSFRNYLGTPTQITYLKAKKRYVRGKSYWKKAGYMLKIRNEKITSDLKNLNVLPNKTHTVNFPNLKKIPDKLISHLIRGIFDGDGSISLSKTLKNGKLVQIHFTGASTPFLESISDILFNNLITKKKIEVKHQHAKTFRIVFSNKNDVLNFKKYIYKDSDHSIRLKRKYERFDKYVKNF